MVIRYNGNNSIAVGTRLKIWRQGQFYQKLGCKIIELPYKIGVGPSDNLVNIDDFNILPDDDGNFLNGNYSEEELDAIHTFGIVRMLIDLYEKILKKTIVWSWQENGNNEPLTIRIRNNDINSRFLLSQKCIELDYYGTRDQLIYNCRTTDLIAHEIGHAILNTIYPDWQSGNAETRGMEEAFCDLSAMFFILSQYDLCEEIVRETNGDFTKDNMLSLFGVGHGHFRKPHKEIRNGNNNIMYKDSEWSPYKYCEVLVGVLYELLIDFIDENDDDISDALKLYKEGQLWSNAIVDTFLKCNSKNPTIIEFVTVLQAIIPEKKNKIAQRFISRNVK